jgi:hypothetical protein
MGNYISLDNQKGKKGRSTAPTRWWLDLNRFHFGVSFLHIVSGLRSEGRGGVGRKWCFLFGLVEIRTHGRAVSGRGLRSARFP